MVEEIVYRTVEDREGYMKTQFVLLEKITDKIITQIHASIYNAHLGRKKTNGKITERMYRPFLSKRIDKCIKTCDVCHKIKISNREKKLAQLMIIKPRRANQLVTIDLAGPFKVTIRGNKYYMVIICHKVHPSIRTEKYTSRSSSR